nr:hypothetical protein [Sphingomonas crusticola]
MARALKVYRTPIGFHDAYVAATSQAAALKAWGTDRNLFARDAAEVVTDPALTAAPLAEPGKVIKLLRGSTEEQMAAASEAPVARRKVQPPDARPHKPPPPRPSRAALDKAEEALAAEERAQAEEVDAVTRQIEALERTRRSLLKKHGERRTKLEAARDKAEEDHRAALERWRRLAS